MKRRSLFAVCVVLAMLSGFANVNPAIAAASYAPTDLGTLGGPWSSAFGINDLGQVVGYAATCSSSGGSCWSEAFLWENGSMIDLGIYGFARDINNHSQVVGLGFAGSDRAFLWETGEMNDLGTLGGNSSTANSINDLGQVVGASTISSGQNHAFLWENGNMIDLGTLGGNSSVASSINSQGQVVGNSANASGYYRGFLWENGVMTDLGTLGGNHSYANDINNLGQAVGSSSTATGAVHAFLWENGSMIDLGLPFSYSSAYGINDRGQVVGYGSYNNSFEYHAFLWENGIMTDLDTLGGKYTYAYDINNLGQAIGESAPVSGMSHAVLWAASAEGQIQGIIEDITGLVEDSVLNKGQGNALIVKLENILEQLDSSKPQVACNLLEAFTTQVQSYIDEQVLPFEIGQLLLTKANSVQSQICQ